MPVPEGEGDTAPVEGGDCHLGSEGPQPILLGSMTLLHRDVPACLGSLSLRSTVSLTFLSPNYIIACLTQELKKINNK